MKKPSVTAQLTRRAVEFSAKTSRNQKTKKLIFLDIDRFSLPPPPLLLFPPKNLLFFASLANLLILPSTTSIKK
jgi:hypothetical protein